MVSYQVTGITQLSRRMLRAVSVEGNALSFHTFSVNVKFSVFVSLLSNGATVNQVITTAISNAINNGQFQAVFRQYANAYRASESTRAAISTASFASESAAPSGPSVSGNNENSLLILICVLGGVIFAFVAAIYLCVRYYRLQAEEKRLSKNLHNSDIFAQSDKYLPDRFSNDYSVPSREHDSMTFMSETFIERHGIDESHSEISPAVLAGTYAV